MSETKYTPGPWFTQIGDEAIVIRALGARGHYNDALEIATIHYSYVPDSEYVANARLMAAAPELAAELASTLTVVLNALDFAMADVEEGRVVPQPLAALEDEVRFIRAALTKAGL